MDGAITAIGWAGCPTLRFQPVVNTGVIICGVILNSKFNKRAFIRWKVYIDRSKMYIGYVQFLMIIFVFIKSLGDNPLSHFVFKNPILSVPIILIVFVCFSLVLGYLDSKFGFREEEIRNHSKSNPVLMDIQKSIDELSAKVGDGYTSNK
ncbi:hypothetical protein [uncultured Microbulbifer sp.]|uniref:hypothetical protein n=1 Tax=uncultured Microbulbifer sp. TaxID=348147 RepID=UPI002616BC4E|nr:hypothetical protein [uncultured Microbulbifer sp.]